MKKAWKKVSEPSFFVLCSCEMIHCTLVRKVSMNNKIKHFLFTFSLIITHLITPMDQPPGQPNSGWLYGSNSSSWTINPFSLITSAASSLVATVHNKLSDEAALKKLGFPPNDSYAETGLAECKTLYANVTNSPKSHQTKELLERCLRRTEYATRVFCILPKRPDFHEVILHCTDHHKPIMPPLLEKCYKEYLTEKLAFYNRLNQQLSVSQDNIPKLSLSSSAPQDDAAALSLQVTIPTVGGAAHILCDSASSLYQTTINGLSDDAAFKKLGWPQNDPVATEQLQISLTNYETLEKTTDHEKREELLSFVLRRTEYLVRAFLALPYRADAFEMAKFIIQQHQKAMFPLLLTLFLRFTTTQHKAVQSASDTLLKTSDSTMVNKIINHTFGTAHYKNIEEIKNAFEKGSLVLLKQQHGIQGCVINESNYCMDFQSIAGDFLVTNIPIKLGVLTADCLPIIFHDKKNNAIGIAHAGWKGSVTNIVDAVMKCMNRNYDTNPTDLSITFGPCIHPCCYSVGEKVTSAVNSLGLADKGINVNDILTKRDETYFFDLLAFNKALLISLGINKLSINDQQSKCTKCNTQYYSHRRGCQKEERQLSYVWIQK